MRLSTTIEEVKALKAEELVAKSLRKRVWMAPHGMARDCKIIPNKGSGHIRILLDGGLWYRAWMVHMNSVHSFPSTLNLPYHLSSTR